MPIVVHLDREMKRANMSLTELSERVGLTLANLSILKTGKAKAVRFSTLEALCETLNCQPGDLLEYQPEERDAYRESADPESIKKSTHSSTSSP